MLTPMPEATRSGINGYKMGSIGTQRRATVITVTVTVAALARALGIEGATSVRIPSYGGRSDQTVQFHFECEEETIA